MRTIHDCYHKPEVGLVTTNVIGLTILELAALLVWGRHVWEIVFYG